uniref:RTR1-type domain-containing protein n=1 Tax=viral metagenome TaxID=1070528 RepID=A0A6C0JQQ9_9ZZZZ
MDTQFHEFEKIENVELDTTSSKETISSKDAFDEIVKEREKLDLNSSKLNDIISEYIISKLNDDCIKNKTSNSLNYITFKDFIDVAESTFFSKMNINSYDFYRYDEYSTLKYDYDDQKTKFKPFKCISNLCKERIISFVDMNDINAYRKENIVIGNRTINKLWFHSKECFQSFKSYADQLFHHFLMENFTSESNFFVKSLFLDFLDTKKIKDIISNRYTKHNLCGYFFCNDKTNWYKTLNVTSIEIRGHIYKLEWFSSRKCFEDFKIFVNDENNVLYSQLNDFYLKVKYRVESVNKCGFFCKCDDKLIKNEFTIWDIADSNASKMMYSTKRCYLNSSNILKKELYKGLKDEFTKKDVDEQLLNKACQAIPYTLFIDILKIRYIRGLCGYPLCDNVPMKIYKTDKVEEPKDIGNVKPEVEEVNNPESEYSISDHPTKISPNNDFMTQFEYINQRISVGDYIINMVWFCSKSCCTKYVDKANIMIKNNYVDSQFDDKRKYEFRITKEEVQKYLPVSEG